MKTYVKPILKVEEKNSFVFRVFKAHIKKEATCNQCSSCHGCRG